MASQWHLADPPRPRSPSSSQSTTTLKQVRAAGTSHTGLIGSAAPITARPAAGSDHGDIAPTSSREKDLFVARRPILDIRRRTYGYELVFRTAAGSEAANVPGTYAASRLVHDGLHAFGLDVLSPRQRLFVNVNRDVLLRDLVRLLPGDRTAVELLDPIEPDAEVLGACKRLARDGYQIVVGGFALQPGFEALVAVADILKVDFTRVQGAARAGLLQRFRSPRLRLLAESIDTREALEEATRLGYTLFQGYYFARPEIIAARDIPPIKLNCLRLLNVVNEREIDFSRVEAIVKQEVSIAVKLLQQLNSAALRGSHKISSIRHALVLLGEVQLRRWISLLALTGAGGTDAPGEVVVCSLVRARFCERIAAITPTPLPALSSFLVGLLSMVDVLVARPIEEVLHDLAIDREVERALLLSEGPLARLLALAVAHERGDWPALSREAGILRVTESETAAIYQDSTRWAHAVMAGTSPSTT
jgi:EAL and modified HD-GYP domain-containing signal transduction protein